jgi:sec-independent protein translocase protein TatB
MLNVGPLELLVVLAVALIVVGPERLPELARSVGRVLRQLRDVQNEVRTMVSSGVDDEIRDAAAEFRKVTGSITRATDVKGAVRKAERSFRDETSRLPKKRTTPTADEAGETGGRSVDRPEEDTTTDPGAAVQPRDPTESAGHVEPETPPEL